MKTICLYPHQVEAVKKLDSGSILCGGVGTGKSITSLAYFYTRECRGAIQEDGRLVSPLNPKPLYIITTARKRDTGEWKEECARWGLPGCGITVVIDSWNNITRYAEGIKDAFYIFDEQRLVGSGVWVKSFLKIAKNNRWMLLSATPGDTWSDYIPVFVANGFYKNKTAFLREHAIYSRYTRYPKVDRYVEVGKLETFRRRITVTMAFEKKTEAHKMNITVSYDRDKTKEVLRNRWDIFKGEPIQDAGALCYILRRICNEDESRLEAVKLMLTHHKRLIIFYNFDYELQKLRTLSELLPVAEWNGHKHEPIPETDSWAYLVQYSAGAEGWNCVQTNAVLFYSLNYSYRIMTQAAGRIDRLNTPFTDLYYYTLRSDAVIDRAIARAIDNKKTFNERTFRV